MLAAQPRPSCGPANHGSAPPHLIWFLLPSVAGHVMRLAADLTGVRVVRLSNNLRFTAQAQTGELETCDRQCEREVGRKVSPDGGYLFQSQRYIHRPHIEADV